MELECNNIIDLYKYENQFVSIVIKYFSIGKYKTYTGVVSGILMNIYECQSEYVVVISCSQLYFSAIEKIFTDIQEAVAYWEYISGN